MREQLWNVNLWPSDGFLLMRWCKVQVRFGVDKTYGLLARMVHRCSGSHGAKLVRRNSV